MALKGYDPSSTQRQTFVSSLTNRYRQAFRNYRALFKSYADFARFLHFLRGLAVIWCPGQLDIISDPKLAKNIVLWNGNITRASRLGLAVASRVNFERQTLFRSLGVIKLPSKDEACGKFRKCTFIGPQWLFIK